MTVRCTAVWLVALCVLISAFEARAQEPEEESLDAASEVRAEQPEEDNLDAAPDVEAQDLEVEDPEVEDSEVEDPDFIPDFVLAAMAENPVSGIVRLPVANAVFFGIPPNQGVGYGLILAPVLPALFKGGWSFLSRLTIPAVLTLPVGPNRVTGFGDIAVEALGHKLFVGRKKQLFDVAFGTFAGFPSATDDVLGSGRFQLGPAIALGITAKRVVTVVIARNQFSVGSGSSRAKVNQLFLQYFLFYNLPKLFYLVYEPVIIANWEAQQKDRWTVPVGLGVGRHHRLPRRRRLSITTRLSGLYNAVRPSRSPTWELLATLVFWKPNPAVFDVER